MTTYNATREQGGVEPVQNATGDITVVSTFALTQALAVNDIINMLDVPLNAVVTEVNLSADELDTNAAATIAYDVGDSNSAQRFIAAAAQSNGVALAPTRMNVAAGLGYQYTSRTTIQVKVHTGPATGATSGTVRLAVTYSMQSITLSNDTAS